jgi:murein DD-endopeptidase MepM/ murein hydrolase activator NlpD
MSRSPNRPFVHRRFALGALAAALAAAVALSIAGGAPASDLQSRLDAKRSQLQDAESRAGVLSTTIQQDDARLEQLRGQVATLRSQVAAVQAQLAQTKAELKRDKARLDLLRDRLKRALKVLRERLVAIYESSEPDAMTVILSSDGLDDLLNRYEYLRRVHDQDTSIAERVRSLRDEAADTVTRVRAERDEIAAKEAELERTQAALEARQGELEAARAQNQQTLARVQDTKQRLEGDVSDLQGQIQAQLQAAQAAQAAAAAPTTTSPALPAGPVQGGESSSGFIWPVNGPITSPFCEARAWESCHPGIDIGVPSGTPIRAASDGTVAIAGPEGGYGNYTCIDHGGGLSSCYGHQQSISVSVGQHVSQGQVIGISDCTGLCFGPHLHFEIRQNGQVVDPLNYLP